MVARRQYDSSTLVTRRPHGGSTSPDYIVYVDTYSNKFVSFEYINLTFDVYALNLQILQKQRLLETIR